MTDIGYLIEVVPALRDGLFFTENGGGTAE